MKRKDRGRLPLECKILLALLAQMILTIPFAYWRGGAFDTVVNKFSKGVIVALLITLVITKMSQLRKLLYIQASAVALITVGSLIVHHTKDGRLMGIQKGILENSNDLAINIAINFPLCMAFVFAGKGGLRKVLWSLSLFALVAGVVATYSRSGAIAMAISCLICLWEFGVKGRRFMLLASTAMLGVLAVGFLVASPRYASRLASLVKSPAGAEVSGTMESHGDSSLQARSHLLKESIKLTFQHPIFGVGPGNFPVVTGEWRVAHNTYTEFGAEAGIPALLLFLALLVSFVATRPQRKEVAEPCGRPRDSPLVERLVGGHPGLRGGSHVRFYRVQPVPLFYCGIHLRSPPDRLQTRSRHNGDGSTGRRRRSRRSWIWWKQGT